eukprot:jgi/Chrzof1/14215/Cz08g29230.t1
MPNTMQMYMPTATVLPGMPQPQPNMRQPVPAATASAPANLIQTQLLSQQDHEDAELAPQAAAADGDDEEIYEKYRPARVTEGDDHPDIIVETASLASVQPPQPAYKHHLQSLLKSKALSNAQIETVIYAMMRFNGPRLRNGARAGFFLGDGAGVGKGRQIAALIKEFWATGGSRVLWVSTSSDLRYDARRDLDDVGAHNVHVYPKAKDPVAKGALHKHYKKGVLFVTYALLVQRAQAGGAGGSGSRGGRRKSKKAAGGNLGDGGDGEGAQQEGVPEGLDNLSGMERAAAELRKKGIEKGTRLWQIVEWLVGDDLRDHDDDDGGGAGGGEVLVVFDECHRAKNLVTRTDSST